MLCTRNFDSTLATAFFPASRAAQVHNIAVSIYYVTRSTNCNVIADISSVFFDRKRFQQ